MKDKPTVCDLVTRLGLVIDGISIPDNKLNEISEILHKIRVRSQRMENRLFKYRKSIERLGFRRYRKRE